MSGAGAFEFEQRGAFTMAEMGYSGARKALLDGMTKGVQNVVRQAKLNASGRPGPNVDTGRFRASINGMVTGSGSDLVAIIGSNVDYAPVLENGFSGSVNVKPFTRKQTQVFGRPIAPITVAVRGHARKMNRPALPSMKPAVESPFMMAAFANILSQEISKYWASGAR